MRVLLIEDNDVDFRLVERALGDAFSIERASSFSGGVAAFANQAFDLVILDLTLDDSQGYATFQRATESFGRTPILILSGLDDEDLALRAVANGAQDYIRKSRLLDYPLDRAARYAVERRRVEDTARRTQQQYRTLFESLPTAAYTCDATGLLTYFNQKAVELWGGTPRLNDPADRYCGALAVYSPDGTPVSRDDCLMALCVRNGVSFSGSEAVIGLPNGERRSVLAHVTPVLDEDGSVQGAISLLVDITAQRHTELKLRESERFARSIVNSLSEHIAILDESGSIIAVNASWERFARDNGGSCAVGIGSNYLSICGDATGTESPEAAKAAKGIRSVLRGECKNFYMEYPCHSPKEQRWFGMSVTPFDGDGPTRVVVKHENITSLKLAEKLASEQCGLRDAVAGMEQVIGVVGHELRTPLATLAALSEFLATEGARNTEDADKFLHQISEEVAHMSDTVDKLLAVSQINTNPAASNWTNFDLAAVIHDVIAEISMSAESAHLTIQPQLDSPDLQMLGDPDAIQQLLKNLLSNAVKHTRDGTVIVRATPVSSGDERCIDLSVRDTGCGIAPELCARLGEAFALNSSIVGVNYVSGSGMGLAICKTIAAAHGGGLTIKSIPGQGTEVTARLRADLPIAAAVIS